jgi:hypothetical protein
MFYPVLDATFRVLGDSSYGQQMQATIDKDSVDATAAVNENARLSEVRHTLITYRLPRAVHLSKILPLTHLQKFINLMKILLLSRGREGYPRHLAVGLLEFDCTRASLVHCTVSLLQFQRH